MPGRTPRWGLVGRATAIVGLVLAGTLAGITTGVFLLQPEDPPRVPVIEVGQPRDEDARDRGERKPRSDRKRNADGKARGERRTMRGLNRSRESGVPSLAGSQATEHTPTPAAPVPVPPPPSSTDVPPTAPKEPATPAPQPPTPPSGGGETDDDGAGGDDGGAGDDGGGDD
jgi:hypothetical protein